MMDRGGWGEEKKRRIQARESKPPDRSQKDAPGGSNTLFCRPPTSLQISHPVYDLEIKILTFFSLHIDPP